MGRLSSPTVYTFHAKMSNGTEISLKTESEFLPDLVEEIASFLKAAGFIFHELDLIVYDESEPKSTSPADYIMD